jgi:hypothetical protein
MGRHSTPADALAPASATEPERGLHFIASTPTSAASSSSQNACSQTRRSPICAARPIRFIGTREPTPGCRLMALSRGRATRAPADRVNGLPQFAS